MKAQTNNEQRTKPLKLRDAERMMVAAWSVIAAGCFRVYSINIRKVWAALQRLTATDSEQDPCCISVSRTQLSTARPANLRKPTCLIHSGWPALAGETAIQIMPSACWRAVTAGLQRRAVTLHSAVECNCI